MGTRGFFGWVVDGDLVGQYNHYDSYPSGKGVDLLKQIKTIKDFGKVRARLKAVIEVEEDSPMTKKEYDMYADVGDPTVGSNTMANEIVRTWYQLLHELQGNLIPYFTGKAIHIVNSKDFMKDSLFCEWAYVLNFDTMKLEVYKGFIRDKHNKNKYFPCEKNDDGYYPVELIAEFQLKKLPTKEEFLKQCGDEE